MQIGEKVEVYCRYTSSWERGFLVEEVVADGYRLRRLSDGSVLPSVTAGADLRLLAHA